MKKSEITNGVGGLEQSKGDDVCMLRICKLRLRVSGGGGEEEKEGRHRSNLTTPLEEVGNYDVVRHVHVANQ